MPAGELQDADDVGAHSRSRRVQMMAAIGPDRVRQRLATGGSAMSLVRRRAHARRTPARWPDDSHFHALDRASVVPVAADMQGISEVRPDARDRDGT
eukprot:303156-Pyramimonas_sp.AAC.1